MHRLHNVDISNEHLVWNDRHEIYFVGPDSRFCDSRIDVAISARSWILARTDFIRCTIRVKRQLNNFSFCRAYLEGCKLLGRYHGCEFGRRLDDTGWESSYPKAGIVDTDLSAADLHGCRFIGCDMSTIELPRWPHFTFIDPPAVYEHALALSWPGQTRIIIEIWRDNPEGIVAGTWNARRLSKEDQVSEDDLRAVIEQVPGVIL